MLWMMLSVGPPGIEPGLYEPESYVLPVYYGPTQGTIRVMHSALFLVRSEGLEPPTFRV